jgi:hypothetical protein
MNARYGWSEADVTEMVMEIASLPDFHSFTNPSVGAMFDRDYS